MAGSAEQPESGGGATSPALEPSDAAAQVSAGRTDSLVQPSVQASVLGRELGGDLPCAFCGYNLRGLSIRATCPECGTQVRATILAVVDPLAAELRPVERPRLRALGIIAWSAGAAAAALLGWAPQVVELVREVGFSGVARPRVGGWVAACVLVSMAGALTLVRVHAGVPRALSALAALGVVLYGPLAWQAWRHQEWTAARGGSGYLSGWMPDGMETLLGVAVMALTGVILLLMRPVARVLVARSVVLRTGRVDRQTMWVMAAAAVVVIVGRVVGYLAATTPVSGEIAAVVLDVARLMAVGLVAVGSVLLTLGLVGSVSDCVRIAGAILVPAPALRTVIREGVPKPGSWLRTPSSSVRGVQGETAGKDAAGGTRGVGEVRG